MSNPKRAVPLIALGLCSAGAVAVWQPREAIEPELPELAGFYAAPAERVETHVLRRGETLGAILGRAQITGNEMANLLLAVREHYNPRRLRPGSEVMVRRWAENGEPRAVELRLNPDSLVRLERRPLGWDGTVKITPVTIDTAYVTGRIERGRTLYQSLVDNDELDMPESERIQLVADLAEIYAYQLDFSREIQAGDEYRFVYERATRPDGTARSRRILVAEVVNRGRGMPAVHFDPPELRGEADGRVNILIAGNAGDQPEHGGWPATSLPILCGIADAHRLTGLASMLRAVAMQAWLSGVTRNARPAQSDPWWSRARCRDEAAMLGACDSPSTSSPRH
jgi:hypothetical protein